MLQAARERSWGVQGGPVHAQGGAGLSAASRDSPQLGREEFWGKLRALPL